MLSREDQPRLWSRPVDEFEKVDRYVLKHGKPFRQIHGREVDAWLDDAPQNAEEVDVVILEEDDDEAKETTSAWRRGRKLEDGSSRSSSIGGSSRCLLHADSTTSSRSLGSRRTLDCCGSALLVQLDTGVSSGSSHGVPASPRRLSGSLENSRNNGAFVLPLGTLDSSGSTYFESEASAWTDVSSPPSCRVTGRAPFSSHTSVQFGRGSSDQNGKGYVGHSIQDQTNPDRDRVRRLVRWVGSRLKLGSAEVEAYARVLEENGFAVRECLRDLTNERAEELGLPRRLATTLRKEAMLGLPVERKFGPLPPAPEVDEEDAEAVDKDNLVEVCIMYEGNKEKFKPSHNSSLGFPTQLRAYPPSSPGTPRNARRRTCSLERSREVLARQMHLHRQESGRRAHKIDLNASRSTMVSDADPDPWLASSFNRRSNRVVMPKARARSVAGFERPKACAEMAAEVAITVPDKEAGWRRLEEAKTATPTMTPPSESLEGIATEASTEPTNSIEPPSVREKITIPADPPTLSKQEMWERVRREVSNCSTSPKERILHTVYTPSKESSSPLLVHRLSSVPNVEGIRSVGGMMQVSNVEGIRSVGGMTPRLAQDYHSRAMPDTPHWTGTAGSLRAPAALAQTGRYGYANAAPSTSPLLLSRQVVQHTDITPQPSRHSLVSQPPAIGAWRGVSSNPAALQDVAAIRPLLKQEVSTPREFGRHEVPFQSRCTVPQTVWVPRT